VATHSANDVTTLLAALSAGDAGAMDRIIPLVYGELRAAADRALRGERREHTLQPTALAHEAYLRLVDQHSARWRDRAHFLAVAAQLMRRILVDHARARKAAKRGGGVACSPLEELAEPAQEGNVDLESLDQALRRLAEMDPRQGRIVELRYFGGLTVREIAEVLKVSPATVKREWTTAKAWLRREVAGGA
jgi:RNA polymerase sigma-70 factor (ECF subfamily)